MPKADSDDDRTDDRRCWFEQEVTRLMNRLYGTALRLTRDPDDAEDVVAEAVGQAWTKLDELRDREQFEGWLFRILNNTFISTLRRRRSRQDMETDADLSETELSVAANFSLFQHLHQPFLLWWGTPEDDFLKGVLIDDIQRALDALPDAFRVAIVLVEVQGYTYEEAADLLEVPLGTVRSRLSRARALLQKSLWEQAREAGVVHQETGSQAPAQGGGS